MIHMDYKIRALKQNEISVLNTYLCETEYIDFRNPYIMEKVKDLRDHSTDTLDYIKQAYLFVRDEISHTWDVKETIVSKKASDVLRNLEKSITGIIIRI